MIQHSALLRKLNCKLLITGLTRHPPTCKPSLQDHIYTNDADTAYIKAGIVQTFGISDHVPVYCIVPFQSDITHPSDPQNYQPPRKVKLTLPQGLTVLLGQGVINTDDVSDGLQSVHLDC